ncbi:MAG: glycosyltransferase family 2 protein [Alphaproteobacteria bacterium]|nr:glycosyltransferase family 2 protein [Alphaproteobacteria bacterium]
MAEISVVIPTENSVNNIDALLLSVFVQSLQDTEIIIVDNASTDGTVKLLDRYTKFDTRVKCIKLTDKTNITDCCRIGVEKATSPYVYFMNGTKYVYIGQGCLQRLLENIRRYDSDLVYSPCAIVNTSTFDVLPTYQVRPEKFVQQPVFNHNDISSYLLFRLYLAPWAKLYKREFLNKIDFLPFEETFFLECLFKAQKISYDLYNLYGCHYTAKDWEMPNVLDEAKANLELLRKCNVYEKYKTAYIYHKMRGLWLGIMYAPAEQKEVLFEQMKNEFADEDFSQYDFNVLRKEDLYWVMRGIKNVNFDDFKKMYLENVV